MRSILNKLTPQMFQQLMKQVTELSIDTEERLKGVIDLIFEKAISEPNFSVAYANMCRCLMGVSASTSLWAAKGLRFLLGMGRGMEMLFAQGHGLAIKPVSSPPLKDLWREAGSVSQKHQARGHCQADLASNLQEWLPAVEGGGQSDLRLRIGWAPQEFTGLERVSSSLTAADT